MAMFRQLAKSGTKCFRQASQRRATNEYVLRRFQVGYGPKAARILLEGLRTVLNKSSSIRTFLLNPLTVQFFARNGLRHALGSWRSLALAFVFQAAGPDLQAS